MSFRRVTVTFSDYRRVMVSFCDYRRVVVTFGILDNSKQVSVGIPEIVPETVSVNIVPEPVSVNIIPTEIVPEPVCVTVGIYERFRRLISIPSKDNAYYVNMKNQYLRYTSDMPTYSNSVTCSAEPKSMYLPEELLTQPDTFRSVLINNNFTCSVIEKYQKVIQDSTGGSVVKNRKRTVTEHQKIFLYAYTPKLYGVCDLTDQEKIKAQKYADESSVANEMYPKFTVEIRGIFQHYINEDICVYKVSTTDNRSECVNLYTATQLRGIISCANIGDLLCVSVYTFLHNPECMPKIFITSATVHTK